MYLKHNQAFSSWFDLNVVKHSFLKSRLICWGGGWARGRNMDTFMGAFNVSCLRVKPSQLSTCLFFSQFFSSLTLVCFCLSFLEEILAWMENVNTCGSKLKEIQEHYAIVVYQKEERGLQGMTIKKCSELCKNRRRVVLNLISLLEMMQKRKESAPSLPVTSCFIHWNNNLAGRSFPKVGDEPAVPGVEVMK